MSIRIIDSIMGSGKTTAAINFMNGLVDSKRFLYVTEYLPETVRIQQGCPRANFQLPRNDLKQFRGSKTKHLQFLVEQNANISCSHQLFKWCPQNILDMIRERGYIIIIDEVINVFENVNISINDLDFFEKTGLLTKTDLDENGDVSIFKQNPDSTYKGRQLQGFLNKIGRQPIVQIREKGTRKNAKTELHTRQWILPKEIFEASDEIYILTYLYDGTPLSSFMEINHIPIEHWCITETPDGVTFGKSNPVIPEYVYAIKEKLHICDNASRNKIGDRENALSVQWYQRARKPKTKTKLSELRRNIRWFMRDNKEVSQHKENERMWASYKEGIPFLQDKGFTNADVVFNKRASNDYRDRRVLAYCANVYAKPGLIKYCNAYGVTYNEDIYSLSTLVQWIWRSAIRDGQEVWLYLPSSRMRRLLYAWIEEVSTGVISGYQKHNPT